ncbi:MAG: ABC transporter ATP-binding protein/permease [Lachnospiraceae bacterium]|nr:ABC transporter ATP-binding protein/permease [Lachnospiraceae bacterium]
MIATLKKFFDFSGEENKKKFVASIILSVVDAVFNAMKVPAIMYMIMGITSGEDLKKYIWGSFAMLMVSLVGSVLVKMKSTMLQTRAGYNAASFRRIDIAQKLRYLPMGYFNDNSIGQIAAVTTSTMANLANVGTRVVMMATKGFIDTIVIIIVITLFDYRIGIICAIGFAVFMCINSLMRKAGRDISDLKLKNDAKLVEETLEYLQGISEVKSYNLFGEESKKLNQANEAVCYSNTHMEFKHVPYMFAQNLTLRIVSALIVLANAYLFINDKMSLLYAIGMTIMAFTAFAALETAGSFTALLRAVGTCVDRANEILNLPGMDVDGEDIKPQNCDIELKNVEFSYEKRPIINGVSLKIPAGQTLAIVGPSGGGKTTLTRLIARFWDVDGGEITLGGKNIKDYSIDSLMRNFSFVFQNVYLFRDTIENNIKFSNPNASHEEVVAAARKACCHDFIEALPDGYNTVIGEGGATLSGGEKQRISIARAIMKDSPVIILDEATANVDPENEKDLTEAIESLTKNKTIIMIAHRLKTVRNADNIIVIADGKIAEQGNHDKLMSMNGIYRRFVNSRELAVSWKL